MSNRTFTTFGETRIAPMIPVAGWTHAYNVNSELVNSTVTGSGTVTSTPPFAVLSTTANTNSSALMETIRVLRYIPGVGGVLRITAVFTEPVVGSKQLIGLGTSENAFLWGYVGTDFVFIRRTNSVDNIITSDEFNFPFPTTDFLDTENGNVFELSYQWLGFGKIQLAYENQQTTLFEPLHIIRYPNTSINTSIVNPTMPVRAYVENTTNNTNIVLKTPSAMAFREGQVGRGDRDPLLLPRSFIASASISTEALILAIRAKTTYQSVTNLIQPIFGTISLAADGTKSTTFTLYRRAVVTGGTWNDYNTNTSSLESNTTATLSSGELFFAFQLGRVSSLDREMPFDLVLETGEILVLTAQSTSTSDVNATVLMEEPF